VVKVLDALVKIIDRLIELAKYREERFRRIFDKLIEPTYEDLKIIHSDYLEMFQTVYDLLPTEEANSAAEYTMRMHKAKHFLIEKRRKFAPDRVRFEATASALWRKHDAVSNIVWPFIFATLHYLVSNNRSLGFDETGKAKKRATRSAGVLDSIEDEERDVKSFVSREIEDLGKRWEEISRIYAELRVRAQVGS
jgi:hypothetical protein